MIVLVVLAAVLALAVVVWFFVARTPEQASRHEPDSAPLATSTFGPGDPAAEDQAVADPGDAAPR